MSLASAAVASSTITQMACPAAIWTCWMRGNAAPSVEKSEHEEIAARPYGTHSQ